VLGLKKADGTGEAARVVCGPNRQRARRQNARLKAGLPTIAKLGLKAGVLASIALDASMIGRRGGTVVADDVLSGSPTRKDPDMSEDQVKRIARDLVAHLELDPCRLESVQRLSRPQPSGPSTTGGEWVVRFEFEEADGVACSSEVALVIVDDATEQARLVDSL
jgi:hypothetical protein